MGWWSNVLEKYNSGSNNINSNVKYKYVVILRLDYTGSLLTKGLFCLMKKTIHLFFVVVKLFIDIISVTDCYHWFPFVHGSIIQILFSIQGRAQGAVAALA